MVMAGYFTSHLSHSGHDSIGGGGGGNSSISTSSYIESALSRYAHVIGQFGECNEISARLAFSAPL